MWLRCGVRWHGQPADYQSAEAAYPHPISGMGRPKPGLCLRRKNVCPQIDRAGRAVTGSTKVPKFALWRGQHGSQRDRRGCS